MRATPARIDPVAIEPLQILASLYSGGRTTSGAAGPSWSQATRRQPDNPAAWLWLGELRRSSTATRPGRAALRGAGAGHSGRPRLAGGLLLRARALGPSAARAFGVERRRPAGTGSGSSSDAAAGPGRWRLADRGQQLLVLVGDRLPRVAAGALERARRGSRRPARDRRAAARAARVRSSTPGAAGEVDRRRRRRSRRSARGR